MGINYRKENPPITNATKYEYYQHTNSMKHRLLNNIVYCLCITSTYSQYQIQPIKVIKTYKHDEKLFTQGLDFKSPHLYESSGLYAKSKLRKYAWPSLKIIKEKNIKPSWFAEGISVISDRITMLTWRERIAAIFDTKTFRLKHTFNIENEGWGLTTFNKQYIMTTGNHCIQFRDSRFKLLKTICLNEKVAQNWQLNDIAYHQGYLYANVWYKDIIVKIQPENGNILTIYDASSLRQKLTKPHNADTLNGITALSSNRLLITGKYWPLMYEIEV